jgi:hypothetical protein
LTCSGRPFVPWFRIMGRRGIFSCHRELREHGDFDICANFISVTFKEEASYGKNRKKVQRGPG